MVYVCLHIPTIYQYIIKKHYDELSQIGVKDVIHEPLKGGGGIS